jgi:hypothetical protein
VQLVLRNSADGKSVATGGSRLRDLYGGLPPVEAIAQDVPVPAPVPQPARPRAAVVAVSRPVAQAPPPVVVALRPAADEMEVIQGKTRTVLILTPRSAAR